MAFIMAFCLHNNLVQFHKNLYYFKPPSNLFKKKFKFTTHMKSQVQNNNKYQTTYYFFLIKSTKWIKLIINNKPPAWLECWEGREWSGSCGGSPTTVSRRPGDRFCSLQPTCSNCPSTVTNVVYLICFIALKV